MPSFTAARDASTGFALVIRGVVEQFVSRSSQQVAQGSQPLGSVGGQVQAAKAV